jgi:hypothetical protein
MFNRGYDLEVGNTVMFADLETYGIQPQAYRCGLLDYAFTSSAGTTDYADSLAPVFISLTGTDALFGLSQQTDRLTFSVGTAAAYTSVANAWRYSSGGTFSNFSSIVNTNALAATGVQTVSWARPNYWSWVKEEKTIGGTVYGPCYWISFNYTTPTIAGLGNDRTSYPATWRGRIFEVISTTRRPGVSVGDYPYKDVVLMEVM